MRKTLAVLLLLIVACSQQLLSQVFLQPKIPANAPTTTQVRAPNGLSTFTTLRAYAIYPVNELTELVPGTVIKQLGFNVQIGVDIPAGGQIKFYMQNTSDQALQKGTNWATITTGMTQVHDGPFTLPVTNGPAEIIVTLDAPFTYTGGGLYVAWDYLGSTFSSNPCTFWADGTSLVPGCASANSASTTPPTTLGTTAFRPQLIMGFDNPYANDLAVNQLKAIGTFSPGLGSDNKVTAMIRNKGSQNQTNIPVSLNITGSPYTGTLSATIPSLAAGDSIAVDFTVPATTAAGTLQIEATVNSDERNTNNSMQITQNIVCDEFRYSGNTFDNEAVGFGTGSGILGALHQSPGTPVTISAIKFRLSNNTSSVGNNIKGVVLDASGLILGASADFPITAANINTEVIVPLTSAVTIPANTNFYAGISQIANSGNSYYPYGSSNPKTTEPNRFYTFTITGGTPALVVAELGQIMVGFVGQPEAALSTTSTGVLKLGQKATFTVSNGFDRYEFRVNNIVQQSSSSNVFAYAPRNTDVVSVNVFQDACSYPAQNTVTMQVTEIVPTAGIVYVKMGASGDGSSWANAASLADAVLGASANAAISEIWVAGGTYTPAYSANDADNGVANGMFNSFTLSGNIKIYGGFAGTETTLNQRDLSLTANKTILSGDLDKNDNPNGTIVGNNAYHVVVGSGNGINLLNGVTIAGGNATATGVNYFSNGKQLNALIGGGICVIGSIIQINNVVLQGNAGSTGGALYNYSSIITVSNSVIAGNKAEDGGGVCNVNGTTLTMINVTISGNNAVNGGGVFTSGSFPPLIGNSIIYGNSSGFYGQNPDIDYSIMQDNIVGTGNLNQDPLFEDMPSASAAPFIGGNYKLKLNSPGINTGDNGILSALPISMQGTDILGYTRIFNQAGGGIIDRGAYELQRQSQTLTVADLTKVYGDADFEPGATASSGLTVAYASSDNNIAEAFQDATDGNKWKIKVKRAGNVTITASQAGNINWYPATDETFELNIATKPVTVQLTAAAISKVYDGTTAGTLALANLSIATGNVINGDNVELSISATTFTYDNKNTGTSKQVTFPLSAISLTGTHASNYSIGNIADLTANTGTITAAELTVTATAQTKVYGESDPALTYIYSGFASGDAETFTGALSRNPGEDAGIYAILENTLSAGSNYTIQFTSANLTITKATQTITWVQDLITGCNGVAPITLTATASSGLPVTYLAASSNIAVVNGQTLTPVHEGATTITAIQAGDDNYEAATVVVKTFSYLLSSVLRQHFADALFFDNSGGNYVQWQWNKNGNPVSGFNTPYYNEATALNGTYYVTVTDRNGNTVQTCPVTLTGTGTAGSAVKVSPNPAKAGSTVNITCSYSETALQGATLQISNISGTVVQRITTVRPVNSVTLPATGGLYVITLTLSNGQKATVNVLVN